MPRGGNAAEVRQGRPGSRQEARLVAWAVVRWQALLRKRLQLAQRAQLLSWRNHMLELMRREIAGEIEPPEAPDLLRGLTGGPRPGSPARS